VNTAWDRANPMISCEKLALDFAQLKAARGLRPLKSVV
jgi:hypothetical protein